MAITPRSKGLGNIGAIVDRQGRASPTSKAPVKPVVKAAPKPAPRPAPKPVAKVAPKPAPKMATKPNPFMPKVGNESIRNVGVKPDTRAPGGGGMDVNGNPIGGGMGAQFNFAGPNFARNTGPGNGGLQPRPQPIIDPTPENPYPYDVEGPNGTIIDSRTGQVTGYTTTAGGGGMDPFQAFLGKRDYRNPEFRNQGDVNDYGGEPTRGVGGQYTDPNTGLPTNIPISNDFSEGEYFLHNMQDPEFRKRMGFPDPTPEIYSPPDYSLIQNEYMPGAPGYDYGGEPTRGINQGQLTGGAPGFGYQGSDWYGTNPDGSTYHANNLKPVGQPGPGGMFGNLLPQIGNIAGGMIGNLFGNPQSYEVDPYGNRNQPGMPNQQMINQGVDFFGKQIGMPNFGSGQQPPNYNDGLPPGAEYMPNTREPRSSMQSAFSPQSNNFGGSGFMGGSGSMFGGGGFAGKQS